MHIFPAGETHELVERRERWCTLCHAEMFEQPPLYHAKSL